MQMTEREIVQSYREAKHPGTQISILADLNCCSREDIYNILVENGVGINRRVLNGGNNKAPMKDPKIDKADNEPKKETPKSKPLYIPECIKTMVLDELELLRLRVNDLKRELDKYESKAEDLEEFLNEIEAYETKGENILRKKEE